MAKITSALGKRSRDFITSNKNAKAQAVKRIGRRHRQSYSSSISVFRYFRTTIRIERHDWQRKLQEPSASAELRKFFKAEQGDTQHGVMPHFGADFRLALKTHSHKTVLFESKLKQCFSSLRIQQIIWQYASEAVRNRNVHQKLLSHQMLKMARRIADTEVLWKRKSFWRFQRYLMIGKAIMISSLWIALCADSCVAMSQKRERKAIIDAYGGEVNINRGLNLVTKLEGKVIGNVLTAHCTQTSNKTNMQLQIESPGLLMIFGRTENESWVVKNGLTCLSSNTENIDSECLDEHKLYNVLSALLNPSTTISKASGAQINGKTAKGISIKIQKKKRFRFWIDPDTHLICRIEYSCPSPVVGLPSTNRVCDYEDYRIVSNLPKPFRQSTTMENSQNTYIWSTCDISEDTKFEIHKPSIEKLFDEKIPLYFSNGSIFVKGQINGKNARICIDSGANESFMNQSYAKEVGLLTLPIVEEGLAHHMKKELNENGTGCSIALGEKIRLENLPMHILLNSRRPLDCYLGMDILRRFKMEINFKEMYVSFFTKRQPSDGCWATLPMYLYQRPFLSGSFNGKISTVFLCDTGADTNNLALVDQAMRCRLVKNRTKLGTMKVSDEKNAFDVKTGVLHSFEIGSVKILNPKVAFFPQSGDKYTTVGLDFLCRFDSVIFDFPDERLLLHIPGESTVFCSASMPRFLPPQ